MFPRYMPLVGRISYTHLSQSQGPGSCHIQLQNSACLVDLVRSLNPTQEFFVGLVYSPWQPFEQFFRFIFVESKLSRMTSNMRCNQKYVLFGITFSFSSSITCNVPGSEYLRALQSRGILSSTTVLIFLLIFSVSYSPRRLIDSMFSFSYPKAFSISDYGRPVMRKFSLAVAQPLSV